MAKTHKQLISESEQKLQRRLDSAQNAGQTFWITNHLKAMRTPQPVEQPIVQMIQAAADYADRHRERFEMGIGEDGFLGPQWERIIQSIRALLNGECGRLDCGTLDSLLLGMLTLEGFEEE